MGSKVLRDGTVISWDDQANSVKILQRASILIVEDRIAEIANDFNELPVPTDAEIIDVTGKILTPGFVNAHCHMWQTAYRSMAPDIFIAQYFMWLSQMGQATKSFSAEDIYVSCLEGYCEGLNAGVTSYVEHANNNWSHDVVTPSYEAANDSGARVWWCYDIHPSDAHSSQQQVATLEKIRDNMSATETSVSMGLAFDGFRLSKDPDVERLKEIVQ